MSTIAPQFTFKMRATAHDREGYYYPRWDRATPITMIAATQQEAINLAAKALGPCRDGRGWYWGFRIDAIEPMAVTA